MLIFIQMFKQFLLIVFLFSITKLYAQSAYTLICKIDSSLQLENETFYLKHINNGELNPMVHDSVQVKNHQFVFHGTMNTPAVYTRLISKKDGSEKWFMLSSGTSHAVLSKPNFNPKNGKPLGISSSFTIPGDERFRLMEITDKLYDLYAEEIDKFRELSNSSKEETIQDQLMDSSFHYLDKKNPYLITLIEENPSNYTSLYLLSYYRPNLLNKDVGKLEQVFNGLNESLRQSEEGKRLQKIIHAKKNINAGMMAPDFSMTDLNGKTIKLSDFRGKKVLLDFWASWCVPCIENLPKLKAYAERENLTVLAISLDHDRNNWLKAIKNHQFDWAVHVSELQGWKGPIVQSVYNIESIPRSIIVDETGKMIDINLKF